MIAALKQIFLNVFSKKWKQTKTFRQRRGEQGEKFAAEFLKDKCGMTVLCRNFRAGRDEIDIVAREREILVFVEVKTRSENDFRGGFSAVNERKRKAIKRAASAYLRGLKERSAISRFDVVEVFINESDDSMRAVHHRAVAFRRHQNRSQHE